MEITEFMTLLGTVGGVQGVVETMKWWQSRRVRRREQEAGVTALENENGRKQIDWLESRLAERDAKIDAIYKELRLTEAEARKCCVRGCAGRVPPSEY